MKKIIAKIIEIIKRKPTSILWHCFIGFAVAWFAWLVFFLAGAGIWAIWTGWVAGSCVGIGIEGYQIIHIKWGQPIENWLIESIMDLLEYILCAATVLFLF